jgi:hypothetical protein
MDKLFEVIFKLSLGLEKGVTGKGGMSKWTRGKIWRRGRRRERESIKIKEEKEDEGGSE